MRRERGRRERERGGRGRERRERAEGESFHFEAIGTPLVPYPWRSEKYALSEAI